MQGALTGNQWPLSCFGPFKDKPSIPDFIEDQSFEEIRWATYEAKVLGNIEQVNMGIYNMVRNARSKMEVVAAVNQDVLAICVQIYDAGSENKNKDGRQQQQQQQPTNPFSAMGNAVIPTQSSIFGQQSSFGGALVTNAQSGVFAQAAQSTASSIFGAANKQQFGNLGAPQTSIFGNAAPNQTASIFGNQTSSAFGAPATLGGSTGTFSLGQISQQQQQPVNTGTGIFGQATQQTTPSNPFGQIMQPQPSANIFGQQQNSAFGGPANIFAQAVANQQPPSTFQQAIVTQPNTMFGSGGATSTTSSIFQQSQPGVTTATLHSNNIFGQSTFASQQQQGHTTSQQQSTGGFFTNQVATTSQQQSVFGGATTATATISLTVYSRFEDLNQEQNDWFQADHFELGKIPTVPPPRELC